MWSAQIVLLNESHRCESTLHEKLLKQRPVTLKRTSRQTVNNNLPSRAGGCVIWLRFDSTTLSLAHISGLAEKVGHQFRHWEKLCHLVEFCRAEPHNQKLKCNWK
jgi:hypothetical protein